MSFFSKIGDWFKNTFFPKLSNFLKSVFTNAIAVAVADIKDVVTKVVAEVNVLDLGSAEKRETAYNKVVEILKAQGKTTSENIIRMTIEMAVAALKNDANTTGA